jgi:hypothetical protein
MDKRDQMKATHTVMNEQDLKNHSRKLKWKPNEELIRLGLSRLELFRICKEVGLLNVQAEIAFKVGQDELIESLIGALRNPKHYLHKKVMGHINEALQDAKKEQTNQIIQFITDYVNNDGMVVENYRSAENYIAPEWQPIVALLDKIDNKPKDR